MNEKEISSVSLASLMKIYPPQPEDLYFDGCILGRRELQNEDTPLELFRFPTRINAFGVVFCSKGSITAIANLKHLVIGPRSIFLCPPGTIVQVESEKDVAVHFSLSEKEFIQRMNIDLNQFLYLFLAVRENPCLLLDEEEWEEVNYSLEELFKEGRSHRKDPISIEIMRQLFRTSAYRLCRIIDRRLAHQAEEIAARDRKITYFNNGRILCRATAPDAEIPDHAPAHDDRAHGNGVDRRIRRAGGEESAETLADEHPGDRLLPELFEPVVLRKVFQTAHGDDPFGVPVEQVNRRAGGRAGGAGIG